MSEPNRRIAAALQQDARASWGAIARVLNQPERTVARRGNAMLARGDVIPVALVDDNRTGRGRPVLIRFRCQPGTAATTMRQVANHPACRYAAVHTGPTDGLAELMVRDRDELTTFLAQPRDGVVAMETCDVLHSFTDVPDWRPPTDSSLAASLRMWDRRYPHRFGSSGMQRPLDKAEFAIADQLRADPRATTAGLAAVTGLSEPTVRNRLNLMRDEGVLRVFALVDPALLGLSAIAAVWLSVHPRHLDAAGRALAASSKVRIASAVIGRYQLSVQVVAEDLAHLYHFLTHVVGNLPGVAGVETEMVLRIFKTAGDMW